MEPEEPSGEDVSVGDDASDLRASLEDPERFGPIFERNHRVVWTYLARLGGREVADDLAGEVFVRAFDRRATFDPERGALRSWLYGIATNLWRTRARSDARGRVALERMQADVGPSDAEIAAVLDVPVGTVRSRLARARDRLRELVEPIGELVADSERHDRSAP